MKVVVFNQSSAYDNSIDDFVSIAYTSQMKYLASDLLEKGLTAREITTAVRRAMLVAKSAGLNLRLHFAPIYTHTMSGTVRDCKLSKMAYGLVLMNANPQNETVGKWQLKVLETYFSGIN